MALFHGGVAVLTLQAKAFHVVLVAERYGLVRPLPLPGDPRRALQLIERYAERNHDQARQHQTRSSQRVRTAFKYLRHECVPALFRVSKSAKPGAFSRPATSGFGPQHQVIEPDADAVAIQHHALEKLSIARHTPPSDSRQHT